MAEEQQVTIRLSDPEGTLLREIADPEMDREDVAMTYTLALNDGAVDWRKVNRAIIDRWSRTTLRWIKAYAWGKFDA